MIIPTNFPNLPFNKFDLSCLNSYAAVLRDKGLLIGVQTDSSNYGIVYLYVNPPSHLKASAIAMVILKVGRKGILFNSARWIVTYGYAEPNPHDFADEDVVKPLGCTAGLTQLKAIEQAMAETFQNQANSVPFEDAVLHALSL